MYQILVEIDFWFVSVLGCAVFSAVIAEEKEERSQSLLRLAGLNSLSILLGKSIAQLTLAISDEPPGGSPTGQPTGAVLALGAVTEL